MARQSVNACPRPEELERAFWAGDGAADFAAHRLICTDCAEAWREIAALRELGGAIETPSLSADKREDMRNHVLIAAGRDQRVSSPSHRRAFAFAAAVALAAAAALYVGLGRDADPDHRLAIDARPAQPIIENVSPRPALRGEVTAASADAEFALFSAQPDETVRLSRGVVEVKVARLAPGERFRIVTDDAEVEVRGTAFRASASGGKLTGVVVHEGLVVVRAAGTERSLSRGESWALIAAATPADEPSQARVIDREPGERRRAAPAAGPSDAASDAGPNSHAFQGADANPSAARAPTDYESGWSHLREKRYADAAAAFERAISSDEPNHADAIYWAGVSHYRAGRRERARVVLHRFFVEHADDRRFAEVAVMLGWIDVERKRLTSAERFFEVGVEFGSGSVKKSAESGLRRLRGASGRKD